MNSNRNKTLAKNIFLMFLVYFFPKVFSFFLVPIYTAYLSTKEYGISDVIITTASLIVPFVSLATPNAILRYTIEKKEDKRPIQIALRVFLFGMLLLLIGLTVITFILGINPIYMAFLYMIVGASVLSDITISYSRGQEDVRLVTICGIGSSFLSVFCNIIFIVVLKFGLYGFLLATVVGDFLDIIIIGFAYRKKKILSGLFKQRDVQFSREVLRFSVPLIFSGLSWWVISSSDRYFVTYMCGASANGIYSVAYKIPTILQSLTNVFYQAWIYSAYESYKTEDGRKYIEKVYRVYFFINIVTCSILICADTIISSFLFSRDFFMAWRYVPFLLLATMFNSVGSVPAMFLSIYKRTKLAARISIIAAIINVFLNYLLIVILQSPIGAAIATTVTFLFSYICNTYYGSKLGRIHVDILKQANMIIVLLIQTIIIETFKAKWISLVGLMIITLWNISTIKMLINKGIEFVTKRKKI